MRPNIFYRIVLGIFLLVFFSLHFTFAQSPLRLAIVDLLGDDRNEIGSLLRASARDSQLLPSPSPPFELIDEELVRVAGRGAGYTGSLNLKRGEARALGQSFGCDFYILGKVQVSRRLAIGEQFYFEGLAGLFIVETRTGRLIHFAFERAQAQSESEARQQLKELFKRGWRQYASVMISAREKYQKDIENVEQTSSPAIEVFSGAPGEQGIQGPDFYQRLKPAYTEQAELAEITATVELEASFQDDGRVGDIEVVRWAGFGLDESAIATVQLLRFKPAQRDGKKLTIRGLVRYNFLHPHSQAAKPKAESQGEIERLERSLRSIQKSGQNPGLVPRQSPERRPRL